MTTNLFVIANVKQLRTGGGFRILLPFFPNILGCWHPKFSNFLTVFHIRVEFGTILEGLRNFSEGYLNPQTPPPLLGTPLYSGRDVPHECFIKAKQLLNPPVSAIIPSGCNASVLLCAGNKIRDFAKDATSR